jgi:hypothetical protein
MLPRILESLRLTGYPGQQSSPRFAGDKRIKK